MAVYPEALVHAASAGDRDAIAALLAAAQPDIRRYARRTCRTTSDVEDAVQETLFVLYRRLGMLRRVGSLSAWLFVLGLYRRGGSARSLCGRPGGRNSQDTRERVAAGPRQCHSVAAAELSGRHSS